ncbi:hypothetical protein QP028_08885 [Corynebacterium suedekumii]|nr:hypothetical protein QP028_08885 [Corynebacterium suedekumii]
MIAGLEQHMPDGVRWNTPEGGFYVWVTLPEGADSYELCMSAIDKGVVFVPGTALLHRRPGCERGPPLLPPHRREDRRGHADPR